jgi:hypothetical protein
MKMNAKSLVLAAGATLSLAGAAMAQDGPGLYFPDYQAAKILAARQGHGGDVQMGSSDTEMNRGVFRIGALQSAPERPNALVSTGGGN